MDTPLPDRNWIIPLIQDNKGLIFKIVNSYCRNRNDREDLAQEIIVELWRSADRYDPAFRFSTWMCSVALNLAISYYRKGLRRERTFELHERLMIEVPADAESEKEGQLQQLQQFISELGELDKALMILYLEEHSYREIAEILGISETNVATKLSRIKAVLRQKFTTLNQAS